MRIRTVKPEFWSHPVMCRLPAEVRLLAIALLCHADDEGYFRADTSIVRGACLPFVDSLQQISGWMQNLTEAGWIEVCEHPQQGRIGRVRSWATHQRLDHPRPSTISTYWNPENCGINPENCGINPENCGINPEKNKREGKGREGKGKETDFTEPLALLAECAETGSQETAPAMTCTPDMIYEDYPRKVGKDAALKAIARALKAKSCRDAATDAGEDDPSIFLLKKVGNYMLFVKAHPKKFMFGDELKFVPHPATWFSQGRYLDEDFCAWEKANA